MGLQAGYFQSSYPGLDLNSNLFLAGLLGSFLGGFLGRLLGLLSGSLLGWSGDYGKGSRS